MPQTMTYSEACKAAEKLGENNDCSVKALAIACDIPYELAHQALADQGRKHKRGATLAQIQDAIKSLGFTYKPKRVHAKTTQGLWYDPTISKGRYLVLTSRHVLATVDGKVEDWSADRRKRVQLCFEVTLGV